MAGKEEWGLGRDRVIAGGLVPSQGPWCCRGRRSEENGPLGPCCPLPWPCFAGCLSSLPALGPDPPARPLWCPLPHSHSCAAGAALCSGIPQAAASALLTQQTCLTSSHHSNCCVYSVAFTTCFSAGAVALADSVSLGLSSCILPQSELTQLLRTFVPLPAPLAGAAVSFLLRMSPESPLENVLVLFVVNLWSITQ